MLINSYTLRLTLDTATGIARADQRGNLGVGSFVVGPVLLVEGDLAVMAFDEVVQANIINTQRFGYALVIGDLGVRSTG